MLKEAEIGMRRYLTRLLVPDKQPILVDDANNQLSFKHEAPRILLLRQDRIGDVLVSTPVLRALRSRYPKAELHMLLSTNNIAVEHAIAPYVNETILYRKSARGLASALQRIRANRYDVVVDLMDNPSTTSTLFTRLSGAHVKLGIDKANAGVYTHVVPLLDRATVHIARRLAELLQPFGIAPDLVDLRPSYLVTEAERQALASRNQINLTQDNFRLGVNASGSGKGRQYPVEATARILNTIAERYPQCTVYLVSDHRNVAWVSDVASRTSARAIKPSPSFHEAAGVWSLMSAIWTPDTSIVHLAAAFNIPSCVMYVHNNPNLLPWYPIGSHVEAVHTQTTDIADIPESDVEGAILRLFAYCGFPTE